MKRFWTKPRIVFFTWALVELTGWLATHYWPDPRVNWIWLVLTIIGFIPMALYMPLRSAKLRKIMLLWIIALGSGMIISFLVFMVPQIMWLISYLGVFWLLLMGAAFLVNARWWTPRLFILGGAVQIVAGLLPIFVPALLYYQYIVAAVAGTGGMLILLPNK
ncbi:hypothetical protein [Marispirochaeta sp.]|uniref:hypothetical protein n=1 Tax=Marispirochaeta sp. TaxID=2038653 RepID=UPI0029C91D9C|nr:hypothetical protein [Marispirochaeta sp.]